MRKGSLVLALALLGALPATGQILERAAYTPPPYERVQKAEMYSTRDEYRKAVDDKRFRFEKVAYKSGELRVFAYVYAPAKPAGRLPAVIFNRGSFVWDDFGGHYLTAFRRFAEAGFAVIAPMYRGSGGAEGTDEMGGADLGDLMETVRLAKDLGFVDTGNLFMIGESRGGMMTFQAIREKFPIRAAAVYGAFTDLGAFLESTPQARAMANSIWPDYAARQDAIHERRSAVAWAEKLDVPLLIMHGGADESVSPSQSIALAAKLESLGKPYELLIRAGSNHVMTDWRAERDRQAIAWFRRHAANR
jgi:dipeptidyl aminopeptidase/acylaminoacyl peptidase